MKVAVGADHDGFEMKQQLAKLLRDEGHEVIDFGNKVYDTNDGICAQLSPIVPLPMTPARIQDFGTRFLISAQPGQH